MNWPKADNVDVRSNDLSNHQNVMHAGQLLLESLIKRKRLLGKLKLEIKRRGKRGDKLIRMKMRMRMGESRLVVRLVMARRKRKKSSVALLSISISTGVHVSTAVENVMSISA
jgi:hypothetical protein